MGGNYLISPIASQSKQMGVVVIYGAMEPSPLTPFNANTVFYDLLDALWRRLNIRYNHGMVHLQVSDGQRWNTGPWGSCVCVCACVCWYIKEQTWLCQAVPHPLPKHRMLHFVFTSPNRRRTKKVPLHRRGQGQPLDPEQIWNSLIKCSLPFLSLAFMVHLSSSACYTSVSFSLSLPLKPWSRGFGCTNAFNVNGWRGGSAKYASCGAPTEKQVQFQVMSWSQYPCLFIHHQDN